MATILLIHGACHWGGCWESVQNFLIQKGYKTYAPSLPMSLSTSLNDHINFVVNLIQQKKFQKIVLVGHSYGGVILHGVGAMVPEKIYRYIFLDAIIPQRGTSIFDLFEPRWLVKILKNMSHLSPLQLALISAHVFGVSVKEQVEWVNANLKPHPMKTLITSFPYETRLEPNQCTYILCTPEETPAKNSSWYARKMHAWIQKSMANKFAPQAKLNGWHLEEIATGHDAMITKPKDVVEIIMKAI